MTNLQSKSSSAASNIQLTQNGRDLLKNLDKYSAPWQRLDIVEGTLQQCGPPPFVQLLDIPKKGSLKNWQPRHDPLFRALAIQAFSHIQVLKEKEKIASLGTDFSKNLLLVLQQEATGGSTQLIRWSAAKTIESIWFDPEWPRQEKPYFINAQFHIDNTRIDKIPKKITEQEVDQLSRLKNTARYSNTGSGEFSEDYKEHLEFWVYGPSSVLFNLPHNSQEYQSLIKDVLGELEPRGVELGVNSTNNLVVELSLKFARDIFNYSAYHQWEISNCLKRFLNSDSSWGNYQLKVMLDYRKLAAESIVKLYPGLWKNDDNLKYLKARAAVIIPQKWPLLVADPQLGEAALTSLIEVVKGELQLEIEQDLNLDRRVEAVRTIGKIKFKNDEDKIKELEKFLQVSEQKIRYESALLLKPYFSSLAPKWQAIVSALLYQLNECYPSLDTISFEQIDKYIYDAKKAREKAYETFRDASNYCDNDVVKNFFKKRLNECEKRIEEQIVTLGDWLSKIKNIQALVKQNAQFILSTLQEIKSVYPDLYNQLIDLEKQAQEIKDFPLSSYSFNKAVESQQKIEALKNGINSGLLKASQDLEKNLEIFIDNLDFTSSEKIKQYLGDAQTKRDAIHNAFSSLFSDRGGNNENFYESLSQINAHLEALNGQLSKIEMLQELVEQNAQLILSTLKGIKLVYQDLYNHFIDWKRQAQEISIVKENSYSYKEINDFKQGLAGLKNCIDSGLLQAIKDLEEEISKLTDKDKELKKSYEENRVWWRNFTITLALFILGLLLSFVLYFSDYGLAGELVAYNDSWQFRSNGLGAIFLSLLWLPFHLFLTWLFLFLYFAGVPLFCFWYAFKLLKGLVSLPERIKRTFKIKKDLVDTGLKLTESESLRNKLAPSLEKILNQLSNKWEYMK